MPVACLEELCAGTSLATNLYAEIVTRDLNESPRPRVLVQLPSLTKAAAAQAALEGLAGTVRAVENLAEVHLDEWDALVTSEELGRKMFPGGGRDAYLKRGVPVNLNVVVLQSPAQAFADYLVDEDRKLTLQLSAYSSVGNMAVMPEGLAEQIAALVKGQLVPLVASRSEQFGIKATSPSGEVQCNCDGFNALLIGPEALVYAACYEREPGSSVGLLPDDVPDLAPWFRVIFKLWHETKPEIYPGPPDWLESDEWMIPTELEKAAELAAEAASFEQAKIEYDQRTTALRNELEALRAATATAERVLVGGQNLELQEQVLIALRELGFDVEDMDPTWPEKEPREDYRIRDSAAPGWMVIGDATGTTKGVKGAKLMTVERYVTKYLQDNPGAAIPKYWVIANQFAERDPSARPADLIRNDELAVVSKDGNLVLDTVAIFLLLVAGRRDPSLKESIREELRERSGQFTAQDARGWITAHT